jgi:hypothetical protein
MENSADRNRDAIIHSLLSLAPYAKALKHGKGYIRLQLNLSGLALLNIEVIKKLRKEIKGILSICPRFLSRSVDIEYDPELIPHDFWETLLSAKNDLDKNEDMLNTLKQMLPSG